jgi:hypothetical protein
MYLEKKNILAHLINNYQARFELEISKIVYSSIVEILLSILYFFSNKKQYNKSYKNSLKNIYLVKPIKLVESYKNTKIYLKPCVYNKKKPLLLKNAQCVQKVLLRPK